MNKIYAFWIVSSVILFLLSFVYFRQNLHRRNSLFGWWLGLGVAMQIVSMCGILLAYPRWMYKVWPIADGLSFALALAVMITAYLRRSCAVNQALLRGIASMIALNLAARWGSSHLGPAIESWLQNIAFMGPAAFLLVTFSNIRVDRLPLYVASALRALTSNPEASQELAFRAMPDGTGARAA